MSQVTDMQARVKRIREDNGFYCPTSIDETTEVLSKLMLVVTEVSEAAEAVRHGDFGNFREELADAVIRILDLAESMRFALDSEINKKCDINEKREYLHGGKRA